MNHIDAESLAIQAISQARLLRHQANLAADVAESQAVALLLDAGLGQRKVGRLTGLSKSHVNRLASSRPPLGVAVAEGGDHRVYDFAQKWIWGRPATARAVIEQLLNHGDDAKQ